MTQTDAPATDRIATVVADSVRAEVPALPADVPRDADLAGYGLNSMKVVEVLFALEDAFGIEIDEDDVAEDTFASVGSIVTFLVEEKHVAR
ncbi:phosphopantetheine-binding protein [Nocardia sp. NPDC050697]|uniref:phosphopantetheine-binding protein n=1 Tax=Nocardia sp. NPDC050697 TaxID=3155158 RepID=UPI0033D843D0